MTDPIETVARAIGAFTADDEPDEPHLYLARNVIGCLARGGYAITPLEPTEAMERAASEAMKALGGVVYGEDPSVCYRAMIQAGKIDA